MAAVLDDRGMFVPVAPFSPFSRFDSLKFLAMGVIKKRIGSHVPFSFATILSLLPAHIDLACARRSAPSRRKGTKEPPRVRPQWATKARRQDALINELLAKPANDPRINVELIYMTTNTGDWGSR